MRQKHPQVAPFKYAAATLAASGLLLAAAPGGAAHVLGGAARRASTLTLTSARLAANGFSVAGHVRLSDAQAARRGKVRVVASVRGPRIAPLRASTRLSGFRFRLKRAAVLSGHVTLTVTVELNGRRLGPPAVRSFALPSTTGGSGSQQKAPKEETGGQELSGTFELTPATESGGKVTGSYFEMFDPGGTAPLPNGNSPLAKGDDTALPGGTDLGLLTSAYQPAPNPAFAEHGGTLGNSLAAAVITPQDFFGFNFGIVTEPTDPQAKVADPLPAIYDKGGTLNGQLTAWAVGWNGQWFNQGTPKPGGGMPSGTTALTGTLDTVSGKFTLSWRSLIVGGPFNNFDGYWHLEGTFVPAA
jgi:hypothetical protein